MSMITIRDGTRIFYKDWGPKAAPSIVFHHGWPLSSDEWDSQMLFFLEQGFRAMKMRLGSPDPATTHAVVPKGSFITPKSDAA